MVGAKRFLSRFRRGLNSSSPDQSRRAIPPYGVALMPLLVTLALISGVSFFVYGYQTLFGTPPRGEYERYGMPNVRKSVGSTQLLGAFGVLLGIAYPRLGALAAAGLALMMGLGLIVRFRIHDAPRLMVPAATLGIINTALVILFLLR